MCASMFGRHTERVGAAEGKSRAIRLENISIRTVIRLYTMMMGLFAGRILS